MRRDKAGPGLPGIGDETVKAKTGKTWKQWLAALDRAGARKLDPREIARLLSAKFGVGPWWRQMVTVGYERLTGKRAVHQTSGGFVANVSRTLPASAPAVHARIVAAAQNLFGRKVVFSTNRPGKSLRFAWGDDGTRVVIGYAPAGPGRCRIAVQHEKLKTAAAVKRMKDHWRKILDGIEQLFV